MKPANAIQTVYTRQNAALNISRTKINVAALFLKIQYPIEFNSLGIF